MTGTFEITLRWVSEDKQHEQVIRRKVSQATVELSNRDVLREDFIQMRNDLAEARRGD